MTVTAMLPAQSVADVITLAKAHPGQLAFASAGTGGAPTLPRVVQDSCGDRAPARPLSWQRPGGRRSHRRARCDHVRCGAVASPLHHVAPTSALAAASRQRHACFRRYLRSPNSATSAWTSRSGTASSPQPAHRSHRATTQCRAGQDPRHSGRPQKPCRPRGRHRSGTPAAFDAFMREETARWGAVIKQAGIRPE